MAEVKTKPKTGSVKDFLITIEDTMKRQDSDIILQIK